MMNWTEEFKKKKTTTWSERKEIKESQMADQGSKMPKMTLGVKEKRGKMGGAFLVIPENRNGPGPRERKRK